MLLLSHALFSFTVSSVSDISSVGIMFGVGCLYWDVLGRSNGFIVLLSLVSEMHW